MQPHDPHASAKPALKLPCLIDLMKAGRTGETILVHVHGVAYSARVVMTVAEGPPGMTQITFDLEDLRKAVDA